MTHLKGKKDRVEMTLKEQKLVRSVSTLTMSYVY